MLPKSFGLTFALLLLVTLSVSGGTPSLQGYVKDANGRAVKGADIRIEAKNFAKLLKTDAAGHYVANGLPVGTYKVTVVINGQLKASILDAKTQLNQPTQLNFALAGKKPRAQTHMVWLPPDINSRIGGGRWVEVDNNG